MTFPYSIRNAADYNHVQDGAAERKINYQMKKLADTLYWGRKSHFIVGGTINSKILENNSRGDKEKKL